MTTNDEDVVQHLATVVMGWTAKEHQSEGGPWLEWRERYGSLRLIGPNQPASRQMWFWPLTDAISTDELIVRLQRQGYMAMVNIHSKSAVVDLYAKDTGCPPAGSARSHDWKRALCCAAYLATGGMPRICPMS